MKTLSMILLTVLIACGDATAPIQSASIATTPICLQWGWRHVEGLPYAVPVCLQWGPESRP